MSATIDDLKAMPLCPALSHALANGAFAHAYILTGDNQHCLNQAKLVAMILNCDDVIDGNPCCSCSSCRRIALGEHPDVVEIYPDGAYLKIEQMRKLQAQAMLNSYEGKYQVFILNNSETMKDEAANSLLKLLEEPPEHTVFLLLAADQSKILPTILSRCQVVSVGTQSFGYSLDEEQIKIMLPKAIAFLSDLATFSYGQVLQYSGAWEKDKDGIINFLAALMLVVRDGAFNGINLAIPALASSQYRSAIAFSVKAGIEIEQAIDCLRKNVNQRLLLDVLFLKLWAMCH